MNTPDRDFRFFKSTRAEATSCRAAIRVAKGVVEDIGEKAARKGKGIIELSKCSEHHSERDMNTLVRRFHLMLPVKISFLQKTPGVRYFGDFNVIHLSSWAEFLVNSNVWHVMLGLHQPDARRERKILLEFWRRFKIWKPNHQIWNEVSEHSIDLSHTLPIILHGDEGRGRKRGPFLVCAYSSCIGFGTLASNAACKHRPFLQMRLNYSESSHVHRMISAALPKLVQDEKAFDEILACLAHDSASMLRQGVVSNTGQRFHMAVLQNTGDWVWLGKSGHLSRTFASVEKRPRGQSSVPRGICHYCRAGQLDIPFEDFSSNPGWLRTMFQPADRPFVKRPILLDIPHEPDRPASFFTFDLWHGYHLGLGKSYCASLLAVISDHMSASNIDNRFDELSDLFRQFCDEAHETSYICSVSKDTISWGSRSEYPNGMWSKGHVTTLLMKFCAWWLARSDLRADPMLLMCAEATSCMNSAFEALYTQDLWLPGHEARRIGQLGLRFMELYGKLARHAYDNGQALWAFMPKAHICHHIWLECATAGEWHMNPLTFAVQVSEDFIGKKSRLARRVAPQQVIKRVLERSLQAGFKHWCAAGFLKG